MRLAFDEGGEMTVGTALTEIVSLHGLMSGKIEVLRHWARSRAGNATRRGGPGNGGWKLDL